MSVFALGSVKASPGVTTTTVALASVWPEPRRPVVVEADPDGGSLAARFGLGSEPGLVSLAAAARRVPGDDSPEAGETESLVELVGRHAQELPGGVPVVVGPPAAEQAHASLATGGRVFTRHHGPAVDEEAARQADLLVDCGRVGPRSPSLPLACEADVLVLVARPRLDEVHHLVHRVAQMRDHVRGLCLITVGHRPYEPSAVADATRLPLAGAIADDRRTAEALGGGAASDRRLTRSPLLHAAREIAAELVARTRTPAGVTAR